MIGTRLDKYEVLQKVGEGGMATVYRGRHCTLNRDVAIKVLHPHLSSSSRNRKRFAREARAIEHLHHDNILEIFDYSGVDTNDCYIITEFVEGETLSSLMDRCGRLPSEIATLVGIRLAEALSYAHRAGILHRDLKPDNVMIRADGVVKLMDFGIARFLDESQVTMTGALVGSPAFMSPEQAMEDPLDTRSDLFSLGTLLFYLVTGHLPFSGTNPSLKLKNIIEGNRPQVAELAPTISATLADTIERLMSPNREERHSTAQSVTTDLQEALREIGIDPEIEEWSLRSYLKAPDDWEVKLDIFLREHLLERGRVEMAAGNHLVALRLFNRLLSLDPDNAEVLALVQGPLHERDRLPPIAIPAVLAALTLLVGIVVLRTWSNPNETPTVILNAPDPNPMEMTMPGSGLTSPAPDYTPDVGPPETTPDLDVVPVFEPEAVAEVPKPEASPSPVIVTTPVPTEPVPEPEPISALELAPKEPGRVAIRSTKPAEIWLEGRRIGSTRDPNPIELAAGEYEFVLKGLTIKPKTVRLNLNAGRLTHEMVDLQFKPATVKIDRKFPDNCVLQVDNTPVGLLGMLGRVWELENPELPHSLRITCGGKSYDKEFANLRSPEVFFPHPDAP